MAVTIEEIVGRIGVHIASAENLYVRPQNLRKALKMSHYKLHTVAPNVLRRYLITHEEIAPQQETNPFYATIDLTQLVSQPKEILSVTWAGDATNEAQPYKEANSREHFRGLQAYDEEELEGRFWWSDRGAWNGTTNIATPKLEVYMGRTVRGGSNPGTLETPLEVGFVREMVANYVTRAEYVANKSKAFDAPSELIDYVISQTVYTLAKEKQHKMAEFLGQGLDAEADRLTQLDMKIQQEMDRLTAQGRDK